MAVQGIPQFKIPPTWVVISVGVEVLVLIIGSSFSGIQSSDALALLAANLIIATVSGATMWLCTKKTNDQPQQMNWLAFLGALATPIAGMVVIILILQAEFVGVSQTLPTYLYGIAHCAIGLSAWFASFCYTARWTL